MFRDGTYYPTTTHPPRLDRGHGDPPAVFQRDLHTREPRSHCDTLRRAARRPDDLIGGSTLR